MQSPETPGPLALWSGAISIWLALLNGGASQAALIQYEYSGIITLADPSTGVAAGTPFSGMFAYDPTDNQGGITIEGSSQYMYGGTGSSAPDGSGLTLQVGGRTVLTSLGGLFEGVEGAQYPGQWGWSNTTPWMSIGFSNYSGGFSEGQIVVGLNLTNPDRAVFGSLAPPPYLSLADFPQAQLSVTELTNPGSGTTLYAGTIESLTEVPEPASATLLSVAAAARLVRSRRQRAKRRAA